MNKIVTYCRVSTRKQGDSGLGLEAQQEFIRRYAAESNSQIIGEFIEVESGTREDRPLLGAALAQARRAKATVVIAKLDRLSRSVALLSKLMEEKDVPFICCDNPSATRLTLHVLAACSENEVRCIRERTKSALAAAKARGVLLGSDRPGHWKGHEAARLLGSAKGRANAAANRSQRAIDMVADLIPSIRSAREAGKSYHEIARSLNDAGHTTSGGSVWRATNVKRALDRVATATA